MWHDLWRVRLWSYLRFPNKRIVSDTFPIRYGVSVIFAPYHVSDTARNVSSQYAYRIGHAICVSCQTCVHGVTPFEKALQWIWSFTTIKFNWLSRQKLHVVLYAGRGHMPFCVKLYLVRLVFGIFDMREKAWRIEPYCCIGYGVSEGRGAISCNHVSPQSLSL